MRQGLIILSNGTKRWYKDDFLHRENGPAVEYYDGYTAWYYEGYFITVSSQEEFEQWLKYKVFL